MKRKIAISARGLSMPSGGVREYISKVTDALLQIDYQNEYYILYNSEKHLGSFSRYKNVTEVVIPNAPRLLWDHVLTPAYLKKYSIDVAFFPKDVIPLIKVCKYVVTVHDMGYFYPGLNAYKTLDTWYMRMIIPFSVKKADRVIADSHFTKEDILRLITEIDADKIHVHHLSSTFEGVAHDTHKGYLVRKKFNLENDQFIFYAGSISPRKNIKRVLVAFAEFAKLHNHKLVITGGKKWKSGNIEKLITDLGIQNRVLLLGHISSEDIPYLYQEADVFLYVSLFEGFGLPILEAMQMGCPVVVSRISSIPEVAGEAALYVDPYDIGDIVRGICAAINNRSELIEKGRAQCKKFSWRKSATILMKAIE